MTRLEDKLGKLEESYKASMARPNLDDSDGEEQIIERLAREVTEVSWKIQEQCYKFTFLVILVLRLLNV